MWVLRRLSQLVAIFSVASGLAARAVPATTGAEESPKAFSSPWPVNASIVGNGSPDAADDVEIEVHPEARPFWKRQPERLRQIREERSIQVSVRREDQIKGQAKDVMNFILNGAGDISRTCDFSYAVGRQFERLMDVSTHFERVVSDSRRQQMLIFAQALHYKGRMLLQTQAVNDRAEPQLRFEILWGQFKGMKGVVHFAPLGLQKCEVSVYASYLTAHPPVPKSLMGFALEVVVQDVAQRMRVYIEQQPISAPGQYHERGEANPELTLESLMRSNHVPMELLRSLTESKSSAPAASTSGAAAP